MSVVVTNRRGKQVTLLNPSEKGHKYAREIKDNMKFTNDGQVKCDDTGYVPPLTDEERSYRAGYLDAQKDSAKCYKARQKKFAAAGKSRLPAKR